MTVALEQASIFQWLDHLGSTFALLGILIGVAYGAWQTSKTSRETREMRANINAHALIEAQRADEAARAREKLFETMMRVVVGVDGVVETLGAAKEAVGFAKGQQAGLASDVAAGIAASVADKDSPLGMSGSKPVKP